MHHRDPLLQRQGGERGAYGERRYAGERERETQQRGMRERERETQEEKKLNNDVINTPRKNIIGVHPFEHRIRDKYSKRIES